MPPWTLTALGDPFLLPPEFALSSRSEIARLFGDAFATQLQHLELGRWTGPIESGYGLHLVFVRERVDGRVPALAEVREAVQRAWLAARRKDGERAVLSAPARTVHRGRGAAASGQRRQHQRVRRHAR